MSSATSVSDSTEVLVEKYRQDGTVLIPQLFSPADFDPVMDDMEVRLRLLAEKASHRLPPQGEASRVRWLSDCLLSLMKVDEAAQGAFYDAMSRASSLHRFCSDPRVCDWVGKLMSRRFEIHHRLILLMSPPGGRWHLAGWHQDWYYNEGPKSTMTLWIPLHDVDKTGGAMTLAKGRHREGMLDHVEDADPSTKWNTIAASEVEKFDDLWDLNAKVGDMVALHSLTPHTANQNNSLQTRFVLNFRFVDLADPGHLDANWRTDSIPHARASLGKTKE